MFRSIDLAFERADRARNDSDTAYFYELMILGEHITKVITLGMLSGIADDRDRNRYRLQHGLVRADGIGIWTDVLGEALMGPAAQLLSPAMYDDQRVLIEMVGPGSWQHDAVQSIGALLKRLSVEIGDLSTKERLLKWFKMFANLRNRTKGHGAPTPLFCSEAAMPLRSSLEKIAYEMPLLRAPWVFLRRNLSNKYHVVPLGGDSEPFTAFKSKTNYTIPDGVYFFAGQPLLVELIHSDADAADFFVPNGGMNDSKFEMLSYLTDNRFFDDSGRFLTPPSALPTSETEGKRTLEVVGNVFSNLPPARENYVARPDLELELEKVLLNERHQIVTLSGRGGIGKTSTALQVLHRIAKGNAYETILWFSARDIDLLPNGPKPVAPGVYTEKEIAEQLVDLFEPERRNVKGFKPLEYFAQQLSARAEGPTLFVFDNFETVRNPKELYSSLDTYVRAPNKILITTRFREFTGDFGVRVSGMTREQCMTLIANTAQRLGIEKLVSQRYIDAVISEADGHPYVIKVLLGEAAREGVAGEPRRVVASSGAILDALFERTFQSSSRPAQRVFLLLSSWRTAVLEAAVEAVMLRSENERIDVAGAIDELSRMSLTDIHESADGASFLTVPLAAQVFGKRKLVASPLQAVVKADFELLQFFGAAQEQEMQVGPDPI